MQQVVFYGCSGWYLWFSRGASGVMTGSFLGASVSRACNVARCGIAGKCMVGSGWGSPAVKGRVSSGAVVWSLEAYSLSMNAIQMFLLWSSWMTKCFGMDVCVWTVVGWRAGCLFMGSRSCWPGTWGPASQLGNISIGCGRLGLIGVSCSFISDWGMEILEALALLRSFFIV